MSEAAEARPASRLAIGAGARLPLAIGAALAATLILLLAHAWAYHFLTDDAFISFRYARNLSQGHGLVFNPGGERVEGYTNFLWVLILAALNFLGIAPERAANPLSLALTVVLWGLVAWFAARGRSGERHSWLIVVPTLALAVTRSVAVWSTSGLETRLFEVLWVAGTLRLVVEIEAKLEGDPPRAALAPWAFALAALTRPDALLPSASAFVLSALVLRVRLGAISRRFVLEWLPFAVIVGAQFMFRRLYYHEWLPNTYYAKIGGQLWWDSGFRYAAAFVLEYGALLWVPLLVGAVAYHCRRGTGYVPLLFAGTILPHALYVIAIGGDHFEYRPFDLYFPFAFLLLADGARHWIERIPRAAVAAAAAWIGLVMVGLVDLPWQSHRQSPGLYLPGFPGLEYQREPVARDFLSPDRDPIFRGPLLRPIATAHRDLLRGLTRGLVGIRQEEHRLFFGRVTDDGLRLRALIDQGLLPSDAYIAMDCVGVIPYLSNVHALDRLGLTDAHVAHSPFVRQLMAHGKQATLDYGRERGVDLWLLDGVHSHLHLTSPRLLAAMLAAARGAGPADSASAAWAADVGGGWFLVTVLPQGPARARARLPRLEFRALDDAAFVREFEARATTAYEELMRRNPGDPGLASRLAMVHQLAAPASAWGAPARR